MKSMNKVMFVLSALCTVFLLSAAAEIPVNAAELFDPVYYAAAYPDVAAAVGTDAAALLNHYLLYGKNEGRLPNASAEPGAEIEVFNEENLNQTKGFEPVPMAKLANLSSLRKKATDGELVQAYNAALAVATPLAGLSREEQLIGIAKSLRAMADSGMPSGIYVIAAVTDGPAYNAGIQPGDIITWMNGEKVGSLKDFQNQVESLHAGDKIKVAVLRNGKDEYTEIEFSVTVGAR